jgi:Domain of unknown function (DUF1707)
MQYGAAMSLPIPLEPPDPKAVRVSHEDRDQVAEALRVAAGDGRLSLEELDERLDAALSARTYADLAPLLVDLPGQGATTLARLGAAVAEPAPVPPKEVVRVKRTGGVIRYEGAWLVPKRLELDVHGGATVLDFTRATGAGPLIEVDVRMHGGSLRIIVPPGYAVDANEVHLHGGSVRDRTHDEDLGAVAPVQHRIVVTGKMTGGSVHILPPQPPRPPRRPGRLRRLFRRSPRS